jgi:hypothetical protein
VSYEPRHLPPEVTKEILEEITRGTEATVRLVSKWPNYRREITTELLGAAAGAAASFGVNPVETVARILVECGMPAELVPPKGS